MLASCYDYMFGKLFIMFGSPLHNHIIGDDGFVSIGTKTLVGSTHMHI